MVSSCTKIVSLLFTVFLASTLLVLVILRDRTPCRNVRTNTPLNYTIPESDPNEPLIDVTGRYELLNSTNLDEFLQEMGVGYFLRVIATKISNGVTIARESNDTYSATSYSAFGETKVTFRDGEEFEFIQQLDGETARGVIRMHGNVWIYDQITEPKIKVIREFGRNYLKSTFLLNGVTCVQMYTKVVQQSDNKN